MVLIKKALIKIVKMTKHFIDNYRYVISTLIFISALFLFTTSQHKLKPIKADQQRYKKIWDKVENYREGPSIAKITKISKIVESMEQDGIVKKNKNKLDDTSSSNFL